MLECWQFEKSHNKETQFEETLFGALGLKKQMIKVVSEISRILDLAFQNTK
jgi:hypothetical protein